MFEALKWAGYIVGGLVLAASAVGGIVLGAVMITVLAREFVKEHEANKNQ